MKKPAPPIVAPAPMAHDHTPSRPVSVSDILPSPTNPRKRFDAAKMAELTASVQRHGVIQPILIRPIPASLKVRYPEARYELVAGERCWQAAQAAGLAEIPALVRHLGDAETLELQVIENLQRDDLHPLEEAEGFDLLMREHGYTAQQLADKIGKSKAVVYAAIKLTALCRQVRPLFLDGKLTPSTALLIARIPVPALQIKAAQEITEPKYGNGEPLSFRDAKKHIQHEYTLDLKRAPFDPADASLLPMAGACTDCPQRAGNAPDDFPDVDADVCTDPECHAEKKAALLARQRQEAEANGATVITGEAAKALMPEHWNAIKGHVKLDTTCYDTDYDPHEKRHPTYRELLAKTGFDLVPTLFEDPYEGELVPVIAMDQFKAALFAAGMSLKTASGRSQEDDKAEKERQKIAIAFRHRLFAEVRAQTLLMLTTPDLQLLASTALNRLWWDNRRLLVRYYYPHLKDHDADAALKDAITTMADSQLTRLLLDVALAGELPAGKVIGDPEKLMAEATRQGFDVEAIRAQVEASLNKPGKKAA